MSSGEPNRYSEAECAVVFARLFPKGFAGDDVLREIAPDGWEKSPLLATFHPSLDQVYEEALRFHENLESLPWRDNELAEMQASLEKGFRADVRKALRRPPPSTVEAYRGIYGHFPRGWPPALPEQEAQDS